MANLCKHVIVLGLLIFLELSGGASGEISAEDVYDLLSRSIFKIENDMENIKRRIDKVEEMFKGISTTVSPLLAGSEIKEEKIMDLKENINMQALAIKKTLTAEKLILRDTVETFESKFAEFKSQIQNKILSINAFQSKSEVMIANIIMQQSTTQITLNSLQKSLNTVSSPVSSISYKQTNTIQPELTSLSSRIASVSSSLSSNISSLSDRIYEKESTTQTTLNSLQKSLNTMSSTVSSISFKQTYTIQPELTSLSSRIASVSSSLSSNISSLSDRIYEKESTTQTTLNSLHKSLNTLSTTVSSISYKQTNTIQPELTSLSSRIASVSSSLSSNISSLSDRIYEKEKRKVAFYAQMTTPDSYYFQNETVNDFNLVILNEGNCFDNSTSIFTAPRSGTYWFSLMISVPSDELLRVDIKNNHGYAGFAVVSKTDTIGTATVVISLLKGDRVWAQTSEYGPSRMHIRSHLTFFSGFLID